MNHPGNFDLVAVCAGADGYVCAQPNGRWSLSLRVLPEHLEQNEFLLATEATPENVEALKNYVTAISKPVASLLTTDDYKSYFQCRAFTGNIMKCSRLHQDEFCCLIGDAAHAVLPAAGEGINSALESAKVFGQCLRDTPKSPMSSYNKARLADVHALSLFALRSRRQVVGTPAERAANLMVTIAMTIEKKFGICKGTIQDYAVGIKAKTGVRSYSDLVAMDRRQTLGKYNVALSIAKFFGAYNGYAYVMRGCAYVYAVCGVRV